MCFGALLEENKEDLETHHTTQVLVSERSIFCVFKCAAFLGFVLISSDKKASDPSASRRPTQERQPNNGVSLGVDESTMRDYTHNDE